MAPNISVPRPSIVDIARPGCAAKLRRSISMRCWGRRWSRPGTTRLSRSSRNSSRRRMARKSKDCENTAAKRWLVAHGAGYARFDPIYLGDDLFSRQPLCEAVRDVGAHFIFVCKPTSHPLIAEYVAGVDLPTHQETVKHGKKHTVYRYRWIRDVPLRDGKGALMVNWFEI